MSELYVFLIPISMLLFLVIDDLLTYLEHKQSLLESSKEKEELRHLNLKFRLENRELKKGTKELTRGLNEFSEKLKDMESKGLTKKEYKKNLRMIEELMRLNRKEDEILLKVLAIQVEEYETLHYGIEEPTKEEFDNYLKENKR